MNTYLVDALQHFGYPVLWLIVFIAAAGAPISGSLLLSAAGAFAAFGDLNIFILFPLALSAAVLGDNLTYFIGRRIGVPLLAWLERQKRFKWISPRAVERSRAYFRRRTSWAIFLTRFLIVALGGPINLLAGLEQYPYKSFLFWDISGQILGALISLGLGYFFAESWEDVAGLFGTFSGLVLAVLVAGFLTTLFLRRVRQHRQEATAADKEPVAQLMSPQEEAMQLQESESERTTIPLPISD
jgi:membrane protein DedA with SNARE-associated domain